MSKSGRFNLPSGVDTKPKWPGKGVKLVEIAPGIGSLTGIPLEVSTFRKPEAPPEPDPLAELFVDPEGEEFVDPEGEE